MTEETVLSIQPTDAKAMALQILLEHIGMRRGAWTRHRVEQEPTNKKTLESLKRILNTYGNVLSVSKLRGQAALSVFIALERDAVTRLRLLDQKSREELTKHLPGSGHSEESPRVRYQPGRPDHLSMSDRRYGGSAQWDPGISAPDLMEELVIRIVESQGAESMGISFCVGLRNTDSTWAQLRKCIKISNKLEALSKLLEDGNANHD